MTVKKLTPERKTAIKEFISYWKNKDIKSENQECQSFWISLLRNVLGIENPEQMISFERPVKIEHTNFIDAYIAQTRVLIEQKSSNIDLQEKIKQSGGLSLTPFEQADRYNSGLNYSDRAKYIVTCNFKSFLIYDMDHRNEKPQEVLLENLVRDWTTLLFLVDEKEELIAPEEQLSLSAGKVVGKLYKALLAEYKEARGGEPTTEDLHSLNVLCVRLVFCLYAEDSGLFGKNQFCDFLKTFMVENIRGGLKILFETLNTPLTERDDLFLEAKYKDFPYVNGDLFKQTQNERIPPFSEESTRMLIEEAGYGFDWSTINPTIFGAVFENTLNPETRSEDGMFYTSVENIHKVIDPLFLDALKAELEDIKNKTKGDKRVKAIEAFREKLGELRFLDPACGSGNFLTETYICLRRLENEALKLLIGQPILDVWGTKVYVRIDNFHGIEINDFAVSVAKAAMWIAECQMMQETAEILSRNIDRLPLKNYDGIRLGNALDMEWNIDGKGYDYIISNPPFLGHQYRKAEQVADMDRVFSKEFKKYGKLDYVACWYKKALDTMKDTKTECALVSTNSICQGESVALLWKPLFKMGLQINFAWQSFVWVSESKDTAQVTCVIIGFTAYPKKTPKKLFTPRGERKEVKNINGYVCDAPNFFIENRLERPLTAGMPKMTQGSKPVGKGLVVSAKERTELIEKYPNSKKFIFPYWGGDEFLYNKERYCLWLKGVSPKEYAIPPVLKRLEDVKASRSNSPTKLYRQCANTPTLFVENRQPTTKYLAIPEVSSENRPYIPIGYMEPSIIASNKLYVIPEASLYLFGVLISSIQMAWMRVVTGRLESRYSYSPSVYNNFPWLPDIAEKQKEKISKTAQTILDARNLYPDCSLATLYNKETITLPELQKAHEENDKAVMDAYGLDYNLSEHEIVQALMDLYVKLFGIK